MDIIKKRLERIFSIKNRLQRNIHALNFYTGFSKKNLKHYFCLSNV